MTAEYGSPLKSPKNRNPSGSEQRAARRVGKWLWVAVYAEKDGATKQAMGTYRRETARAIHGRGALKRKAKRS